MGDSTAVLVSLLLDTTDAAAIPPLLPSSVAGSTPIAFVLLGAADQPAILLPLWLLNLSCLEGLAL